MDGNDLKLFGYLDPVAEDFDGDERRRDEPRFIEASGLLEGLEGEARAERVELIHWLLERGITVEEIRDSYQPMLLASRRVLGVDGTMVSARQISAQTGVELELLERIQRASGLPRVDDPDAAVHLRIDGETAAYAKKFIDLGFTPTRSCWSCKCSPRG